MNAEHFDADYIHTTPEGRHFRHGDGAEVDGEGNPIERVVYTGTSDWWQIVTDNGEIETDEGGWGDDEERAAELAGINTDYDDSWICRVTAVEPHHSAIRVGDYVCSDGYGADVIFVRL